MLFWRSFTHWIGGMGILVLTVAMLPSLGNAGQTIVRYESPGPTLTKMAPKTSDTSKLLYLIYGGMTVAETVLLKLGGMSFFDAMLHTFGTVGTGGYSSYNASIGAFHSGYFEWVIGIFMMVGYGLTESLATVSCIHMDKPFTIGSVGRPIHSIDVKICSLQQNTAGIEVVEG